MQPKRDTRIVFYLNDQEAARLKNAVAESGMERPDWLRTNIESAIAGAASGTPADTLEAQAAARHSTGAYRRPRSAGATAAGATGHERLTQPGTEPETQRGSRHQRQVSTGTARRRRDGPKLVAILADELTRSIRLESKQRPTAQTASGRRVGNARPQPRHAARRPGSATTGRGAKHQRAPPFVREAEHQPARLRPHTRRPTGTHGALGGDTRLRTSQKGK